MVDAAPVHMARHILAGYPVDRGRQRLRRHTQPPRQPGQRQIGVQIQLLPDQHRPEPPHQRRVLFRVPHLRAARLDLRHPEQIRAGIGRVSSRASRNPPASRRTLLLDARAADLTAALDQLLADPTFGPHIDRSRITALGFSLGGATALGLGGLRFDGSAFHAHCTRVPNAADCVFLAKGGLDLAALPPGFAADLRDPRVTSLIAIDPGMTYAATPDSAAELTPPTLFINLGTDTLWSAGDVGPEGSGLAARLPDARRAVIAPAHHYTFLAECKPEGPALLAAESDDPVCDDPAGTDRARAHREIIDLIVDFAGL